MGRLTEFVVDSSGKKWCWPEMPGLLVSDQALGYLRR